MSKTNNSFQNLYFNPIQSIGFRTPQIEISRFNSSKENRKKSYLYQIKKYEKTPHAYDSQISYGFGCSDAEYISLFKMTKKYNENINYWDKYIKKIIKENYYNYYSNFGCCPVHKISWIDSEFFESFFPNSAPDLEKMLKKFRANKNYISNLNQVIILINKSIINGLKKENEEYKN